MSIASLSYIFKDLFIIIFSIKNNASSLWYPIDYLILFCLKQF